MAMENENEEELELEHAKIVPLDEQVELAEAMWSPMDLDTGVLLPQERVLAESARKEKLGRGWRQALEEDEYSRNPETSVRIPKRAPALREQYDPKLDFAPEILENKFGISVTELVHAIPVAGKNQGGYRCSRKNCGFHMQTWNPYCPICQLGAMRPAEYVEDQEEESKVKGAQDLMSVKSSNTRRITTGVEALDRALGEPGEEGFPHVAYMTLTGQPGAGKSTILSQIVAHSGFERVLYVTSEELLENVKKRWIRMGLPDPTNRSKWMATTDIDEVVEEARRYKPTLTILDSVNKMRSEKIKGRAGSKNQTDYIFGDFRSRVLGRELQCSGIFVCQITKDGVFAGSKDMEHMVDICGSMIGQRRSRKKQFVMDKNRHGPCDLTAHFRMETQGLVGLAVTANDEEDEEEDEKEDQKRPKKRSRTRDAG